MNYSQHSPSSLLRITSKARIRRMFFFSLLCFSLCSSVKVKAETTTVASPDQRLAVTIDISAGRATYAVTYDHRTILLPSALGLHTNIGDFSSGLTLEGTKTSSLDESYDLTRTKQTHFHYVANRLDLTLRNANRRRMTITFQVADQSIAFRYSLLKDGETACVVVSDEVTAFRFPDQTTTFLCPQAKPMTGWMRSKPSYEEEYALDAPMTNKSAQGAGYTFPCLFHVGADGWALVSETGTRSLYCGCHLSDYDAQRGYTIAFPQEGENNGFGSATASFALPGQTPWRTIVVGNTLRPIAESTVQFDVVKPLYQPSQTYTQGRSTWSWIVWQDRSMNYDDQKTFIDLAHDMGYECILIDALWETQVGRNRMPELFRYARQKGVQVFLWYNSNGAENDAPQDAKQCMNTSIARKAEMKWLKENGVKGMKVDFFGGDKQETMRLYEDILSDANDYGLQVIFHGCTLPRGWERMYPNYVASEAVLASENLIFSQHFDDMEAQNACLHPFLRNAVGSMDWGGSILNHRMAKDNQSGQYRRTSDIFQLGTAIIFQSSVQNFGITPNNLTELPPFVIDFMKQVPTTWDETRFIEGYPGHYVVIARRHGQDWYVSALNGTHQPLKLTVNLPMMAGKQVQCLTDAPLRKGQSLPDPTCSTLKINNKALVTLHLASQGAEVLVCKN